MKLRPYQQRYIDKVRQAYRDGFRAPCVVAPCGSGKSVIVGAIAKECAAKNNHVLFLVHRRELCDQIEQTFQRLGVSPDFYQIGMVQTVARRLGKIKKPSLIITDENHHGLAKTYRKIYDYFSDVLRLGFTATPIRLNGSGLGDVNDILIEEVTAKWLIENHFLAPYRYYAPKLIDEDRLKLNTMKEFSTQSISAAIKENKKIFGDVIRHYQQLADGEKAICYCHDIEASLQVRDEFQQHGIKAEHIDAKTPKLERQKIIERFRSGEIKILTNVDLIGEGFDVPSCSTVILLRPTKSLSLFIQQSMRGMRYEPGKTSIIIDHVGNAHRHGLPDDERAWSLEAKDQRQSSEGLKTCAECYSVYTSRIKRCPYCGYVGEIVNRKRELEIERDEQLEEIKEPIVLDYRKPEDCKNMTELHQLAKNRGYKKGWAFYQGKRLGLFK